MSLLRQHRLLPQLLRLLPRRLLVLFDAWAYREARARAERRRRKAAAHSIKAER